MLFRKAACTMLLATASLAVPAIGFAQMDSMNMKTEAGRPMPSPPATASATLGDAKIGVKYNSPSIRHRKIFGGLVPYGKVWRTGANPATTLTTSADLHFGNLLVPAGTHTIYTYPSEKQWLLILNKQTGQWGTDYDINQDLGRVPMTTKPVASPQEVMSITFENTTPISTEFHMRWETTDRFVKITK